MKFPAVYIKWLDHASFSDQGWKDYDDIETLETGFEVETVGFLAKEDDNQYYIVLCAAKEVFSGVMAIQKGTVKEFKIIAEG